jgi:Cu/Ag efflux protein CusF
MYRMLGMAAAAVLTLGTSMAQAEEVTGAVENIDLTRNTFEVEDKVFTASPMNTVGPTLEELKEGDQVTVFFEDAGSGQPINAMTITKEEE